MGEGTVVRDPGQKMRSLLRQDDSSHQMEKQRQGSHHYESIRQFWVVNPLKNDPSADAVVSMDSSYIIYGVGTKSDMSMTLTSLDLFGNLSKK